MKSRSGGLPGVPLILASSLKLNFKILLKAAKSASLAVVSHA